MGNNKLLKRGFLRCFHQGGGYQAHPSHCECVVILLRCALVIGEAADAASHEFRRTRRIGRLQVEPGDAQVFPVMKELSGK